MAKLTFNKLKNTEAIWLPQVPTHWELVKVRHLFKESTKKGFPNEPLLVASQEHGVVSKDAYGKRTVEATKDLQNLKLVEQGDFVISLRSFQGGIELAHERGIISPAYTIMKEARKIDKRYFKNLFKSPPFISLMTLCVKGIREGQNIDYPTFKNEYLPLPPIEEQIAISAYLDKKNNEIGNFIRNKQRMIELLEEQRNSIINNILTSGIDPNVEQKETNIQWLGKVPKHWEIKRLKIVVPTCVNGIWGEEGKDNGNDIYCIRVADIDDKTYGINESSLTVRNITKGEQKVRLLKNNDLIIEKSGGGEVTPVGRVVLYNLKYKAVTSNFMAKLKVDKRMDNEFVYFIFRQLYSNRLNVPSIKATTGIQNLDFNSYMQNKIAIPPIEEQRKIVELIKSETSQIDLVISKAQKEITAIKEYREALITDLVIGKRSVPQLQMN